MSTIRRILALASTAYFVLVASALADAVHATPVLTLANKQTWALLIGGLVPLGTYVVNHVGPWASEPAKAFVLLFVSAVAGGLYTALATTSFGWNSATLQMVLTSVGAALAAHKLLWQPSTVSTRLGGGTNGPHRHIGWVTDTSDQERPAPDG